MLASGYWMDIGTPERYLQGTYDILNQNVATSIGTRLSEHGGCLTEGAITEGRVVRPAIVGAGSYVARDAIVGGLTVLGENVTIGEGSHVTDSVPARRDDRRRAHPDQPRGSSPRT